MKLPEHYTYENKALHYKKRKLKVLDNNPQKTAWDHYIRNLKEAPDPVPPLLVFYLCHMVGKEHAGTKKMGPDMGQTRSSLIMHVGNRTVRRWIKGDVEIPWAPVQVLLYHATASKRGKSLFQPATQKWLFLIPYQEPILKEKS